MKKIALLLSVSVLANIAIAQVSNNGLETWRTYAAGTAVNLEAPNQWFGIDSLVFNYGPLAGITPVKLLFKDNSAHGGSFAAKLLSSDMGGFVAPAMLVNARPDFDAAAYLANPGGDITDYLTYTGGTPVTQRYNTLTAWIKYMPMGADEAVVSMQAIKTGFGAGGGDSVIGTGTGIYSAIPNYTKVSIPVQYTDATTMPDKVIISFASSNLASTPVDGSVLYVDDVNIVNIVGVKTIYNNSVFAEVFPNPVVNQLNIRTNTNNNLTVKIYGVNGAVLSQKSFSGNTSISTENMAAGLYFYQVIDEKKKQTQHGKFEVVK